MTAEKIYEVWYGLFHATCTVYDVIDALAHYYDWRARIYARYCLEKAPEWAWKLTHEIVRKLNDEYVEKALETVTNEIIMRKLGLGGDTDE